MSTCLFTPLPGLSGNEEVFRSSQKSIYISKPFLVRPPAPFSGKIGYFRFRFSRSNVFLGSAFPFSSCARISEICMYMCRLPSQRWENMVGYMKYIEAACMHAQRALFLHSVCYPIRSVIPPSAPNMFEPQGKPLLLRLTRATQDRVEDSEGFSFFNADSK